MTPRIVSPCIRLNGTSTTTSAIPFAKGAALYTRSYTDKGDSSVQGGLGASVAYTNTQTGSSTGSAIDLWNLTIAANTLGQDGDKLVFEVTIFAANTANNKQVTVLFGGTTIGDTTNIGAQNGHAVIRGTIQRFSSTHAYCSVTLHTATKWVAFCTYTDVTATLSNNQSFIIRAAIATANNDSLIRSGWMTWSPGA